MRNKKAKKALLVMLIAIPPVICVSLVGIARAGWLTAIQDSAREVGDRYLYNISFNYAQGTDKTIYGLEKSSQLDLPSFNDDRYSSVWKIGTHSYSGIVSIQTLINDSDVLTPVIDGKTTTYTITLTESKTGLKDGYFEIVIEDGINMSNANAHLDLDYLLVTKVVDSFLVFNINATYTGLYLDHFVYDDGGANEKVFGLNDAICVNTGGADASKLVNKTLTLTAYFK